jgi:geranylgeranyl diphosphate synthase type II
MDDDDLRRGRPTTHKKFGEAMAILAGDALVVLAFELLARHVCDRRLAGEMVLELAERTGWEGMIGGQAADIAGQSQDPSLERTHYIHERKTAACLGGLPTGGQGDRCRRGGTEGLEGA